MALSTAVGSLSTGTGAIGTTVVVSGLGFQPKVVFFWWNGRTETTDAVGRRTHQRGFGVAASASARRSSTNLSQDTPTAMVTNRSQDDTECIFLTTTADGIDGKLDLQSMDSGGFTLVVDDVMVADYRVHYLAIGGSDLTDVNVSTLTKATVTGNQDVTTVGFEPDLVIFFSASQASMASTVSQDSMYSYGAAVSSSQQGVISGGSNDAATTSNTSIYCNDAECIVFLSSNLAALNDRATFVGMLSNGYTINWTVNGGSGTFITVVALKGISAVVGSLLTQTDTTTDIVESGFGFTPSAAMFFSHGQVESTAGTLQSHDYTSVGAFSSTSARAAMGAMDQDNAATAVVGTAVEHDEVYIHIPTTAATIDGLMDIKSIDSDGFTCIMDDADPAQSFVWYFAVGPAGAVADAGAGVLVAVASGGDTARLIDAGQAASAAAASGADAISATEGGQGTLAGIGSGADAYRFVDAGQGTAASAGSGSDTAHWIDAGVSTLSGIASGASVAHLSDAGQGLSATSASGVDVGIAAESGGGALGAVSTGADRMTFTEVATALMGLDGSGADTFSGGGGTIYTEAGQATSAAAGSGADVYTMSDTGEAVAALFGFGSTVTIMVDVGDGALIAVGSGSASGESVSAVLPYQGGAYQYDSVSSVGSVTGGTIQAGPNQSSPTGSINDGTVQPSGSIYD